MLPASETRTAVPRHGKPPSGHPGAEPSPETGCNNIIHPQPGCICANWESRTKNTPCYAARAASDASQSTIPHAGLDHPTAGPHHQRDSTTGLSLFSMHICIYLYAHTHKHIAGSLPSETKPVKQSRKHQIRPSPFHPAPERTFAHSFTSKMATLRRSQLLHDLNGAARLATANARAPRLQKSLSSKSHRLAPQMPASRLLAAEEVTSGCSIDPARLLGFPVPQRGQKPGFGMGDHALGK